MFSAPHSVRGVSSCGLLLADSISGGDAVSSTRAVGAAGSSTCCQVSSALPARAFATVGCYSTRSCKGAGEHDAISVLMRNSLSIAGLSALQRLCFLVKNPPSGSRVVIFPLRRL